MTIAMSAATFYKNYTGDKFYMIMTPISRKSEKNSDSAITKHTQQPYQLIVKEEKFEDIMEMEFKRVSQTALLSIINNQTNTKFR